MGTTFTSTVTTSTAAVEMDGLQRFNPCSVCVWIVYLLAIGYTAKRFLMLRCPKFMFHGLYVGCFDGFNLLDDR